MKEKKSIMTMIYQLEALAAAVSDEASDSMFSEEEMEHAGKVLGLIYLMEDYASVIRKKAEELQLYNMQEI